MELKSGIYIIRCLGTESHIGRNDVDLSMSPKPIVTLPEGVDPPRFIVERLPVPTPEANYTIRAEGGLIAEEDKLLWAFLAHETAPPTKVWLINPQEQYGKNIYTVEKPDHSAGWVVPDEKPETQVAVLPLIVHPTDPPQFLPRALFEFVRIDRD